MTSPAANPPRPNAFAPLVEEAVRELQTARRTAAHALRIGVNPREIIDYVRGAAPASSRAETEAMLARSPWAMGRVVALVKAKRRPASLGARILASHGDVQPLAWGVRGAGDHDADLAELLDRVG